LWERTYAPAARYALWPTWHAWLVDYRELLVITQQFPLLTWSPLFSS